MKITISDKYRIKLSKAYLDVSEALPRFRGSPIAMLQEIREHQRSRAEETFERTRPPQGVTVEYPYFRLYELFQFEDREQLRQGLLKLFPTLDDVSSMGGSFSKEFSRQARHISGTSWWNLGTILRNHKKYLQVGNTSELTSLPEEVEYIEAGLFQVLPSLFVVSLDVRLNEKATQKLSRLQGSHFLPDIRFTQLIPRNWSYSETPSDAVMQREILVWFEQLRGRIEDCLRPHINGYFMRQSTGKVARLPAFEVIVFKGIPDTADLPSWLSKCRGWWKSFGLIWDFAFVYTDNKLWFIPSEIGRGINESESVAHRLVVLWEPYLKAINNQTHEKNETAIIGRTKDRLSSMLRCLVALEYLHFAEMKIEGLRESVFRGMSPGWPARISLGLPNRLNNELLQASVVLDRLTSEFEQEHHFIASDMENLMDLKTRVKSNTTDSNLRDDLLNSVKSRTTMLKSHLSLIKDWFSQYSALRNAAATGCLNIILVGLTLVLVILTLVLYLTQSQAK